MSEGLACVHEQPPCSTHAGLSRQIRLSLGHARCMPAEDDLGRRYADAWSPLLPRHRGDEVSTSMILAPDRNCHFRHLINDRQSPTEERLFHRLDALVGHTVHSRPCAGSALGPAASVDVKWAAKSRAGSWLKRLRVAWPSKAFQIHFFYQAQPTRHAFGFLSYHLRCKGWSC